MSDPLPLPRVVEYAVNGVPMRWFERDTGRVESVLRGRYSTAERMPFDNRVRRVLDVGAREGAFVRYAWTRWPGCWIDCVEPDMLYRALLDFNRTPGMRVLDAVPVVDFQAYDVVRWSGTAPTWEPSSHQMLIADYTLFPDERG